ncbi:hypothetical protein Y032_0114g459 [Ancylostoma ceylanicum]|uniref:ShKT domain-containing protein n=1 Tax=Ancylostoma ceylanicum TaxID=53326 RepID=A0A016TD95_9BILA|nr:hypothetical protein Y032_0114g459 [Ancylostoma ceylanicum]
MQRLSSSLKWLVQIMAILLHPAPMTYNIAFFVLLAASSSVVTIKQFLKCGNGAERNCCDRNETCAYWASIGECTNNADWMLPNCQLSCRSCGSNSGYLKCGKGAERNCCDRNETCAYWASIGECTNNAEWMLPNCQLSCRSCGSNSEVTTREYLKCEGNCCDRNETCAYWASIGECRNNADWMLPNCQLSCQSCNTNSNKPSKPSSTSMCGTGRDSKCCDREKSCADWASWGECENRPSFMLRKCKLSCNACRPTLPKASGLERCRDNGMTREVRQKLLDMHNKYRMMVAKGQAKDKAGGNAPMAARMLKMEYDCDIEENAMRHAVGCAWGHSAQHERENLGENLYYSTNPRMNHVKAAEDACKLWFDELATRGVGQEDNILTDEVWNKPGQIGHYTQMVWQDSYKLGCYVNSCPSMTYVVCQYGPQGNWIDDPIYETGSPCTTDDDCMCSNCKCSRSEGLCIVQ